MYDYYEYMPESLRDGEDDKAVEGIVLE